MANENGDKIKLDPEDIAQEVKVILTKDGRTALFGPLDNLPLVIKLLGQGIDIASQLLYNALPKRIIPATTMPPLPLPLKFQRKPGP
jgi:hypothetical protein